MTKNRKSPYECDGLSAYREKPLAVMLPKNIEEGRQALQICKAHNTTITTRGSATGLAGGALPLKDGIVFSLSNMNQILHLDPLAPLHQHHPRLQFGNRHANSHKAGEPYRYQNLWRQKHQH